MPVVNFSILIKNFIFLCLLTVAFSRPAHAYLDPGTGSLITQALAGFLLTTVFTFKLWTKKLKQIFKKNKTPTANDE